MKTFIYSGICSFICYAMSLSITVMLTLNWKELLDTAEGYDTKAAEIALAGSIQPELYD